jgi:hypothetical protein
VAAPPEILKMYRGLYFSLKLEKLASAVPDDAKTILMQKKREVDSHTFALLKTAAVSSKPVVDALRAGSKNVLHGVSWGVGAGIPAAGLAMHVSKQQGDDAKKKAIATGIGLAALGGALYGIHKSKNPRQRGGQFIMSEKRREGYPTTRTSTIKMPIPMQKQSDILNKIAAVGYLDHMLAQVIELETSPSVIKLARENITSNIETGIQLFKSLLLD